MYLETQNVSLSSGPQTCPPSSNLVYIPAIYDTVGRRDVAGVEQLLSDHARKSVDELFTPSLAAAFSLSVRLRDVSGDRKHFHQIRVGLNEQINRCVVLLDVATTRQLYFRISACNVSPVCSVSRPLATVESSSHSKEPQHPA